MSRIEKRKRNKKLRKTVCLPIAFGFIIAVFLLLVVDYRINSVMGLKKIRIVDINLRDRRILTLNTMGYDIANIDLIYIKNDIADLKKRAVLIKNNFEDSVRAVISQE